jgi:hypothetical protein
MSRQWMRYCSIVVGGSGGKTIDLSELRCRFTIRQFTLHSVNEAYIRITNVKKETAKLFTSPDSEYKDITLDLGYVENHGILFKGKIKQAIYGRENPTETFLELICSDAEIALRHAVVNKTFKAGSTAQDHYDEILNKFKEFGVTTGKTIGIDLSQMKYPRATTLFGMGSDIVRTLAKSVASNFKILNGEAHLIRRDKEFEDGPIEVNSNTGMIGSASQTIQGIQVRILINPNVSIFKRIHLNEDEILRARFALDAAGGNIASSKNQVSLADDGVYKVLQVETTGDTRGNPWYMDLECLVTTASEYAYVPKNLYPAMGVGGKS